MPKKAKPGFLSQWREQGTLARYILPASGTMIGMCTTLIGLVKILEIRTGPSRADEFTALAALCFLVSAMTSYLAIRHGHRRIGRARNPRGSAGHGRGGHRTPQVGGRGGSRRE